MTKNAVELRSVSFTYAGFDAPAVDDVSLAVAPGECIVLCGESGCGKTTATRIVNGLAGGFYEGSRTGVYCQALADKIGVMISTLSAFCVPTAFPTSEICQA